MMKSINASDSSLNDSQPLEKKSKMNPLQGKKGKTKQTFYFIL